MKKVDWKPATTEGQLLIVFLFGFFGSLCANLITRQKPPETIQRTLVVRRAE